MKKIAFLLSLLFTQSILPSMSEAERFQYAIFDAQNISPIELTKNLTPIVPWNKEIKWKNGKLVVVSFMAIESAIRFYMSQDIMKELFNPKNKSNGKIKITAKNTPIVISENDLNSSWIKEESLSDKNNAWWGLATFPTMVQENWILSWVTVAPELQQFAFNWAYSNNLINNISIPRVLQKVTTRLNEKLGLTPDSKTKKVIVELVIDPKNLIRPSIDSEIIDSTSYAQQVNNFPGQAQLYQQDIDLFKPYEKGNATPKQREILQRKGHYKSYQEWFEQNQRLSYKGQWAMPWTQLGYTYDYSQDAFNVNNHFGLSEFWIKPGSNVEITGIYSLDEYIKQYPKATAIAINDLKDSIQSKMDTFERTNKQNLPKLIELFQTMLYELQVIKNMIKSSKLKLNEHDPLVNSIQMQLNKYKDIIYKANIKHGSLIQQRRNARQAITRTEHDEILDFTAHARQRVLN